MNNASVRRVSLRRKRKSSEAVTEVPEQKRVSPSPNKSECAKKHATKDKQKNKVTTISKGTVPTDKAEITTDEGEMTEVRQGSPQTPKDIQEVQSTPKSRSTSNSMASTCSILSSTLMHYSPDMPFYSSQLGATQECEVVWDCNSPGFSKEDLKKMYNKDGSPSPVAAPIPPRTLFPFGRKSKDSSMKKNNSNYAAQVTAQLDALLLKISGDNAESRTSSEDSSQSDDKKLDPGLPRPLKEMGSQPFTIAEVESSIGEQDTQSLRNLSLTEFSEDLFAEDEKHAAPSVTDVPVVKKKRSSSSEDLVGEFEEFQVSLECSTEMLKEWSPEAVKKTAGEKVLLKESSDSSTDEFDDDFFNESVIKSTQALEEAFLGEKHCDDLHVVVQDIRGLDKNDDMKEYVSPVVGKPRKPSTEKNCMNTKVENRSKKLSSSSTHDIVETLLVDSNSDKQNGPCAKDNQLTGVHRVSKVVLSNNDISGNRYNSQFKLKNQSEVSENENDSKGMQNNSIGYRSGSDSGNCDELGIRKNSLRQMSNYMVLGGDKLGQKKNITSNLDSIEKKNNSYRPRSDNLGLIKDSLESRNDNSGTKSNRLGSSSNPGFQSASVLTKKELHYKSNSQNEMKRSSESNKVGLPRSRSSHCFQTSCSADTESKSFRRTNSSEHTVKTDLNDAVFGEDFDDSFFDTILSTLPENFELSTSEKNSLVTGIMPSAHVGPAQKTNYKFGSAKKCSNEADVPVKSEASSSVKLVSNKQNHPQKSLGMPLAESFGDDDLFQDDVLNIIDQVESQYATQPQSQSKCSQVEISRKREEAKRRREKNLKKKHAHGHYFPVC